jgi:hypothetical protein
MPILMNMTWDGVTAAQYDEVRRLVAWETAKPPGGLFHVAAFSPQGLRVSDVWENTEDFNRFAEQRLMPGVAKAGITTTPQVEVLPVHALFTPAYQKI